MWVLWAESWSSTDVSLALELEAISLVLWSSFSNKDDCKKIKREIVCHSAVVRGPGKERGWGEMHKSFIKRTGLFEILDPVKYPFYSKNKNTKEIS